MLEKLSTADYTFAVCESIRPDGGQMVTITLTQTATEKIKVFVIHNGNVESLTNHMNSLSDDLCAQWFSEKSPKKKK